MKNTAQKSFEAASEKYLVRVDATGGLSEKNDPERERLGKILLAAARKAASDNKKQNTQR